jgi:hypothetical protein
MTRKILNPVCSEAVFRLGGREFRVDTSRCEEESFASELAEMDDKDIRDYRFIDNIGGGADFPTIEKLIAARKQLGREAFAKIPPEAIRALDRETIAIVVGEGCHLVRRPGQLLEALLAEGVGAEVAVLGSEKARQISALFRRWKSGEITGEEFRARALSLCFGGRNGENP